MLDTSLWTPVDRARVQKLDAQDRLTSNRLLRWQRQSVARSILPGERVAKCYRVRVRELVDVLRSQKFDRAHYGGLATCASVWSCPVCASKITERRRVELQQAVDRAIERGMSVFMVTWTIQHRIEDTLNDVRQAMTDAMRSLKSGRFYQDFVSDFALVGNVTGTEVKYGTIHGWHYHRHSIFFSSRKVTQLECVEMQARLSAQYQRQLKKLGRYADSLIGVDVRLGDRNVSDYVSKYGQEENESKWSLSAEITKGSSKAGFGALAGDDHFIPFEFLDLKLHGEEKAGDLFAEYAITMKGNNQLRWSDGLRELFDLGVVINDEELAAAQDEDAVLFAQITLSQWKNILRREKRGQLLEVASSGNIEWFQAYLSTIK